MRPISIAGWVAIVWIAANGPWSGCSRQECASDIDCPICSICDGDRHVCVKQQACLDMLRGLCRGDVDCDPLQEFCLKVPGEEMGLCQPRSSCPDGICLDCIDGDGDLYGANCQAGPDCDDDDATAFPTNPEVCDGKDNDCNPATDEEGQALDCPIGELCRSAGCCADECPQVDASTCVDASAFHTCGNQDGDACTEWGSPIACEVACLDGICIDCQPNCDGKQCGPDGCGGNCGQCLQCEGCTVEFQCVPGPHARSDCHVGDVWWFNTCDEPYELRTECGAGICLQGACCQPQDCTALGYACGAAMNNCGTGIDCGPCTGCASQCSVDHECLPISGASVDCYQGDLWSLDSCGNPEQMEIDCGPLDCQAGDCTSPAGPLSVADLEAIDMTNFPGGDNVIGTACVFRAKAYNFCPATGSCSYLFSFLGFRFSAEDLYYDGDDLAVAQPLRFLISYGAAGQCNNPPIGIAAGEYITITHDGGVQHAVYLPAFEGVELTLYVAADGSTFYDAELTQLAQPAP